ncbi:MAG: Archease protein family, partial [Acidobacteria bacterium]|nr:Archease protein family [Acidobacteriota bacterium]
TAWGGPSSGLELRGPPVKAVTYHDLAVEQESGGWRVRVIFDV